MFGAFLKGAVGVLLTAGAPFAFFALLLGHAASEAVLLVPLAMIVGGLYLRFVSRQTVRVTK